MTLHRRELVRADGRRLWLYAATPLDPGLADVPAPIEPTAPNPHLRYHPLRGEWVTYAAHRQARTFLPPSGWDPLAPTTDPAAPTELPPGRYDVAVFENRFPSFVATAHDPPAISVPTTPANGSCEVVVFTQDPVGSLGGLTLERVELVLRVWGDRTRDLGLRPEVAYVMPFENRGVEVGVTLTHPHGQIYAYPFVPPIAQRELVEQRAHLDAHGRGLLEAMIDGEITDGRRLVSVRREALAFVPVCARYAYELWVMPKRAVARLGELDDEQLGDLAYVLRDVLRRLDALFARPMPYVLVVHQAPTDGAPHPEAHVHVEIYPALRTATRLKYLAGSEIGAGVFTADTLPEEKAAELRAVGTSA